MFNPFARRRSAPRSRPVCLGLESLERRDCPSALGVQPAQNLWTLLNTAPVASPPGVDFVATPATSGGNTGGGSDGGSNNYGPLISLSVTYNARRNVTLSGTVCDTTSSPAGLTVTFGGKVNATAVTDSTGAFTLTVDASGLGDVTAATVDRLGLVSNTALVTLRATAPVIANFNASEGQGFVFTFTGTVTDQTPSDLVIQFSGVPSVSGQTAVVGSDGSFSLSVRLQTDGSDDGMVVAQTTDWWGLQSNLASVNVHPSS